MVTPTFQFIHLQKCIIHLSGFIQPSLRPAISAQGHHYGEWFSIMGNGFPSLWLKEYSDGEQIEGRAWHTTQYLGSI